MLKKLFKNRIFLCVFTALIVGATSVYAVTYFPSNQVTYDNSTSGLKSSDVQGAIDELYSTCSSSMTAGNYLYYAENRYINSGNSLRPYGYTLYRCNSNGENCTNIDSDQDYISIGSVYTTNDYLYYAVNQYALSGGDIRENGYILYRCNLNGESCANISSDYNVLRSVDSIYATSDYLYYAVNTYTSSWGEFFPIGYTFYRCNLNGENCTRTKSSSNSSSIVS